MNKQKNDLREIIEERKRHFDLMSQENEADSKLIADCLQNHRIFTVTDENEDVQIRCDIYYDGSFYEVKDRVPDLTNGLSLETIKKLNKNHQ